MTGRISESPTIANLFQVDLMTLAIIADASHLLKLIRNMLQNKGTVYMHPDDQKYWKLVTNEISWKVIEDVVEFQEKHELRINPKLTSSVLRRGKSQFGKMDVGCAIAVFSKDTTAAILSVANQPCTRRLSIEPPLPRGNTHNSVVLKFGPPCKFWPVGVSGVSRPMYCVSALVPP